MTVYLWLCYPLFNRYNYINKIMSTALKEYQDFKEKQSEFLAKLKTQKAELEKELGEIDAAIEEITGKKASSKVKSSRSGLPLPTEKDLPKAKEFLGKETKQLRDVAKHLGVHPLALRKLLAKGGEFKLTKKENKAFVSAK